MATTDDTSDLLRNPLSTEYSVLTRSNASYIPHPTFDLARGEDKHYQQQYGDMYFLRLAKLKPIVESIAEEWEGFQIGNDTAHRVDRVLDVRQGELCWVAGTIYIDMPLKPNILDDISKDAWIAAPPPREKYVSPDGHDQVMLEDESGRLRLTGPSLNAELLVTGCIIAVLGTENANGDFEVIQVRIPELPSHPEKAVPKPVSEADAGKRTKVAIVSGLDITGESGDSLALDLLVEWLLGESTSLQMQTSAAEITRLIIAGNSLAEHISEERVPSASIGMKKNTSTKKYGYDASAYNPAPPLQLDLMLSTLLPSIPITLIPGPSDPANVSLPQQPLHPALFPHSRAYAAAPITNKSTQIKSAELPQPGSFHPVTNPVFFTIDSTLFLGTGGQPIDDIGKYVSSATTLELMEYTLRWRLVAPTAPDTLWCYPYQANDPFVLSDGQCPHVYFVGNQSRFETTIVQGAKGQAVRCLSVPRFSETGQVIILDLETLEVEIVKFEALEG